jgi:cell wall-associated NlpC family hydrolase
MLMPMSFTPSLRRLAVLLGLVLTAALMPTDASADKPKPRKPGASASRHGQKKAVQRGTRRARSSGRSSSRRSRRARVARHVATGPLFPDVAKANFVSDSADVLRDSIVSVARQQIGTPYVWGADTPGRAFDCSGLVKYVMSWLNVRLPRTANEQAYTGIRVGRELDRMKPGDLLTFGTGRRITHIAIYSGNGKYVHASRPGVGVVESLLNPNAARFRGAIRLVADADTTTSNSALIP